jgi:hypothetical protein
MKAIVPVLISLTFFALSSCGWNRLDSEEFRNTAEKAEKYLFSISVKQAEIRDMLHSYNRSVPEQRRLTLTLDPDRGLSDEALRVLKHHTEEERDASCRGLLERIFEIQKTINEYRNEMESLLASLPPAHQVKRGETHYGLSMDYLMKEHGLSRQSADSIASTAALSSDILEGFNIWFLYDNGMFSTLVTQGKAHLSPAAFAKVVKKQILDDARAQGSEVEYESILDSLKRCGALLTCVKQASAIGM